MVDGLLSPEDEFIADYASGGSLLSQNPNFRRATILPFGIDVSTPVGSMERYLSIRPAIPQGLLNMADATQIPYRALMGEYGDYINQPPIADDEMTDMEKIISAGNQFTDSFAVVPSLSISATRGLLGTVPDANVLYAGSGDPMNFSRLVRHNPITDTSVTILPTNQGLLTEKIIDLESLRGGTVIPFVGDKTAAGGILTEIDGVPLAYSIRLEGGQDFMRDVASQSVDNSIWASHKKIIDPMYNVAKRIADDTGEPVYGAYVNMANVGQDFSTMTADALVAQLPTSKISKSAMKEFNDAMKVKNPHGGEVDDFIGIDAPLMKLREYITKAPPKVRKKFVKLMDTGNFQKMGFPDVGKTRYAITQPRLRSMPENMTGMNIGRIDTDAGVLYDPQNVHSSYNTHIRGIYEGRLKNPIPMEYLFQRRLLEDPDIAGRGLLPQTLRNSLAFSPEKSAQRLDDRFYENLNRLQRGLEIR
jgi:hypothetical protein